MKAPNPSVVSFVQLATIFLMVFNFTLTLMASPYITWDLGGSNTITVYTIVFYSLGSALSIPLGSALLERFNTYRLFTFLLGLFAITSVLCALAPNFFFFNLCRFLQGFTAGPFYILCSQIHAHFVPKEKKDGYTALIVTIFAIVPVFGACFGGWIAYDYNWRYLFYYNVPVILLLIFLMRSHLEGYHIPILKKPFDRIGYFFYFLGILSLGIVATMVQQLDWYRSTWVVSLAVIGSVSFIFFVLWSLQTLHPIFNFSLIKNRVFAFALINVAVLFSIYFGMVVLLALWLTLDVNYTPIWIGFLIGSMAIVGLFPRYFVEKRFRLLDARIYLGIAIVFFAISAFHTSIFDVDIDFGRIAISRFIAGFGVAFFLPPIFRLCFRSFPSEQEKDVMTYFQVIRSLSSGLGGAVYSIIWQRRESFYHSRLGGLLTDFSSSTKEFFAKAKIIGIEGLKADAQLNYYLDRRAKSLALDDSFYLMGWILVGLFFLLLLTLAFRWKGFSPEKQNTES
jgi:MFS transporter, DHA2 family, multidrug resistance protein